MRCPGTKNDRRRWFTGGQVERLMSDLGTIFITLILPQMRRKHNGRDHEKEHFRAEP